MDLKNTSELDKLVKFCRKNGITSLKSGEFAMELAPSALFPESNYKKKKNLEAVSSHSEVLTENEFTEQDALFWSSAGIPENGAL